MFAARFRTFGGTLTRLVAFLGFRSLIDVLFYMLFVVGMLNLTIELSLVLLLFVMLLWFSSPLIIAFTVILASFLWTGIPRVTGCIPYVFSTMFALRELHRLANIPLSVTVQSLSFTVILWFLWKSAVVKNSLTVFQNSLMEANPLSVTFCK